MTNSIEVQNLIKTYKKATQNAVADISFTVKEGEFFALLGPNGAGKTTTISILTTTLSKTSGEISIAGFDLEKQAEQVRQNIGVIFQNPSLDLNLTAEENLRFHAILYNLFPFRPVYSMMPEEYKKLVGELAEVLDITKDMHKAVSTFSGGMKRKLEIIRTLMHKPKVLFLDEPTSGLDPLSRKNLWEYLKKIRNTEGTTIFLTTHYLDEAEGADTVCMVNHGKVVIQGSPDEIKKKLLKEYLIIDAENKNALKNELTEKNVKFEENEGEFKIEIQNTQVQELLKNLNTDLSVVKTIKPTLEEAYLEIIGNLKAEIK